MPGSLLATAYPSPDEWRKLVKEFTPEAIAHKLLLAHTPYVFRDEPLKYALFRRTVADVFEVEPTNVFIVGSAMAGRSLKGKDIEKAYSSASDIDALIVSEHLFTAYVMRSLEWVRDVTRPTFVKGAPARQPVLTPELTKSIGWFSGATCRGIWRPDSLPRDAAARRDFFDRFASVSLKTLGLQLSDDTVADVNGRIARSFDDAVGDLAHSIWRLRKEFQGEEIEDDHDDLVAGTDLTAAAK
jgi:hypothetical protein